MPNGVTERRRCPRRNQHDSIIFSLYPDGEDFYGIVFDVSDEGLGFCSSAPLREGQEITLKNSSPVGATKGTVKWVGSYLKSFHRAGLLLQN